MSQEFWTSLIPGKIPEDSIILDSILVDSIKMSSLRMDAITVDLLAVDSSTLDAVNGHCRGDRSGFEPRWLECMSGTTSLIASIAV